MNSDSHLRNRTIIKFAAIGAVMNLILFAGKVVIGLSTHSKAIVLDSVNSISDSVSCAFVIISSVLAMRNADKSHPFGYGRLEYAFSLLFSAFIMYLGVRSIIDSVGRIIGETVEPTYTGMSIVIMSVSLSAKIIYGLLARMEGKRIRSTALIISGTDSLGDSLIALSVLVGILIQKIFGFMIDDYLCILVALMIINTGFSMMRQCMNRILGMRIDPEFSKKIRTMIILEDGVINVSNLILHDYGEGSYIGSVDIEVDENLRASDVGRISSSIKEKAKDMGLVLTSVGVSGVNTNSAQVDRMEDKVLEMVSHHKSIVRIHSFSVNLKSGEMSFYVVQDFSKSDNERVIRKLHSELVKCFPEMKIEIFSSINAD